MKTKKTFSLTWICEPFEDDPSFFTKSMFGGLAIYHSELMKLMIAENPGNQTFKLQTYDFDIWNGLLICTDYPHHASLKRDFIGLVDHPVLKKWLYLPMSVESFETTANLIALSIVALDARIGIVPGVRKRKKKTKK